VLHDEQQDVSMTMHSLWSQWVDKAALLWSIVGVLPSSFMNNWGHLVCRTRELVAGHHYHVWTVFVRTYRLVSGFPGRHNHSYPGDTHDRPSVVAVGSMKQHVSIHSSCWDDNATIEGMVDRFFWQEFMKRSRFRSWSSITCGLALSGCVRTRDQIVPPNLSR
jgi:hypothetical protein